MQVTGGVLRIARPRNEWYTDVDDPEAAIGIFRTGRYGRVDLFTFWQRVPEDAPRFHYHWEPEFVAVLPITTYDHWWRRQIDGKTRNLVRKAEKKGVSTRPVAFDDALLQGIARVFNETPIRQGRPFRHYGKSIDRIREDLADRMEISVFIGAFVEEQLIGFVKLLMLPRYAMMVEIISEVQHRDKAPQNALVAAAVKECEARGIPFVTYSTWGTPSLSEFKRHNGFQRVGQPRYYVPLSLVGRIALACKLHKGAVAVVPDVLKERLRAVRKAWYERRLRNGTMKSERHVGSQ